MLSYLKNTGILVVLFFAMVGCSREKIVLETFGKSNVPVVSCFITANNSFVNVSLTKTTGIIGHPYGEKVNITDAEVTITNLTDTIYLTYDSLAQEYFSFVNQPFLFFNQTYYLNIKANGKLISAKAFIPEENNNTYINIQTNTQFNPDGFYTFKTSVNIKDNANQENYYRLIPLVLLVDTLGDVTDTINQNVGFGIDRCYLQDANQNGADLKTEITFNYTPFDSQKIVGVKIGVVNCSKTYYEYHKKLNTLQIGSSLTDPLIIPNNINGGIGVFAGYGNILEAQVIFK